MIAQSRRQTTTRARLIAATLVATARGQITRLSAALQLEQIGLDPAQAHAMAHRGQPDLLEKL